MTGVVGTQTFRGQRNEKEPERKLERSDQYGKSRIWRVASQKPSEENFARKKE